MDVYDIQSLAENKKHYMNESVLDYMMPNVILEHHYTTCTSSF